MTPHSTTGVSPAELMLGRKLRNRLDLLWPRESIATRVLQKQDDQVRNHSRSPREISWQPTDPVMARNYSRVGPKWTPGLVTERTGPVSYRCVLSDGRQIKRHQDQLHSRLESSPVQDSVAVYPDSSQGNLAVATGSGPPPNVVSEPHIGSYRRSARSIRAPAKLNL